MRWEVPAATGAGLRRDMQTHSNSCGRSGFPDEPLPSHPAQCGALAATAAGQSPPFPRLPPRSPAHFDSDACSSPDRRSGRRVRGARAPHAGARAVKDDAGNSPDDTATARQCYGPAAQHDGSLRTARVLQRGPPRYKFGRPPDRMCADGERQTSR